MSAIARPYEPADVESLSKTKLLALVARQPERWPLKGRSKKINASTVTKARLREALLDTRNGFTTTSRPLSPRPLPPVIRPAPSHVAQMPGMSVLSLPRPQLISPEPAHGEACPDQQFRTLRLYIEDYRPMNGPTKTTVSILVPDGGPVPGSPGAWSTPVRDVIEKLQGSHGAIKGGGPVKLGIPDDRDQDFTQYFTEGHIAHLVEAVAVPNMLVIPADPPPRLTIRIEFSSNSTKRPLDDHLYPSNEIMVSHADVSDKPLERAHERKRKRKKPNAEKQDTVTWLKMLVADRPGYDEFRRSQNRVLQNPDIARTWEFAAQFLNAYHKQKSEVSDAKISKAAICAALNVGETWLGQAEEAHGLMKMYGDGGTHPAHEVIEEIGRNRDPPLGKGQLIEFLRDWKTAHPTTSN